MSTRGRTHYPRVVHRGLHQFQIHTACWQSVKTGLLDSSIQYPMKSEISVFKSDPAKLLSTSQSVCDPSDSSKLLLMNPPYRNSS